MYRHNTDRTQKQQCKHFVMCLLPVDYKQ